LAEKCRDDAAKAGINKWALEIVAGGDLIRKLIGALNEAEFRHTGAISGPGQGRFCHLQLSQFRSHVRGWSDR